MVRSMSCDPIANGWGDYGDGTMDAADKERWILGHLFVSATADNWWSAKHHKQAFLGADARKIGSRM
jgi:hypothetical protein